MLRIASQLQRSIALPSTVLRHTFELAPFEETGKKPWHKKKALCIGSQRCYFRYEELSKSGDMEGYRQMTQSLQVDHQLVVGRERVRELPKRCDPEGIALKSKHRLKRRRYVNKGPNYL